MSEKWPDWLPLRETLRGRKPYGAPQLDAKVRLNTNENPYPLPPQLIDSISRSFAGVLSNLNRYPDRNALPLRQSLASYVNRSVRSTAVESRRVSEANIWPANGSNEVLQSLLLAFGQKVAGFAPSYSMHTILSEAVGRDFIALPLRDDFTPDLRALEAFLAEARPTIFFVTTPNNPTGKAIEASDLRLMASMVAKHQGLLIVDEAYGEFSDIPSAVDLVAENPAIVVVRTMSKAFAFAGARVGYAIARPEVIDALELVRLPYHLSALTQAAAIAALDHAELLLAEVEQIKSDREVVAAYLAELGLDQVESEANFILFGGFDRIDSGKTHDSASIWRELADRGILVRDVGIDGWLRVTIGTRQENELFLNALRSILSR